jgi:hypothetical protein
MLALQLSHAVLNGSVRAREHKIDSSPFDMLVRKRNQTCAQGDSS